MSAPKTAAEAKALVKSLRDQLYEAEVLHRDLAVAECPFRAGDYVKDREPRSYGRSRGKRRIMRIERVGSRGVVRLACVERNANGKWGKREHEVYPDGVVKITPQEAGEPA